MITVKYNFSVDKLNQLPKKMKQYVMYNTASSTAQMASKFSPYKTGNLSQSIHFYPANAGMIQDEVVIGPRKVQYAVIQELGGMAGRGRKARIRGKFYMKRAMELIPRQLQNETALAFAKYSDLS